MVSVRPLVDNGGRKAGLHPIAVKTNKYKYQTKDFNNKVLRKEKA
jgi:hypothetical protein